jgi:hypothetical protein
MTTIKIEQEINTQKLNEEFPILLTGKVFPNEYQELLTKTNENVKKIRENYQKTHGCMFFLSFIYIFSIVLSISGVITSLYLNYKYNSYVFYSSIGFAIFSSLFFIISVSISKKSFDTKKNKLILETKQYIQNENVSKFYYRGIQFLLNLKEKRMSKQLGVEPSITILICDNETTTFIQNQIQNFNQINLNQNVNNINSNYDYNSFQGNSYQSSYVPNLYSNKL